MTVGTDRYGPGYGPDVDGAPARDATPLGFDVEQIEQHRRPRVTIVLAVLALTTILVFELHRPTTLEYEIDLVEMPTEFVDYAGWSLGLIQDGDLPIPTVRFVHHGDDASHCRDRRGMHRLIDDGSVIDICTTQTRFADQRMVLHELSHAWVEQFVDEERREEFRDLRGWTYWRNHEEAPWHENGSEQAAEILLWGLIDRPTRIIHIHDRSCEALERGYRVLTGKAPPYGLEAECLPGYPINPPLLRAP